MPRDSRQQSSSQRPEASSISPDDIRKIVEQKLDDLQIQTVVLVDDEFAPILPQETWTELVDIAQEHDQALFARIEKCVSDFGTGKVDEYPSDNALIHVLRAIEASTCQQAKDALGKPRLHDALVQLETYLVELKRTVKKYWTIEDVPKNEKLYFLDFRMRQEADTQGLDASLLLRRIIEGLSTHGDPPGAVLMSRVTDNRPTPDDIEDIARNGGGFVRSIFRYLDKTTAIPNKVRFLFLLNDLLDSLPLGRAYFSQVRSLRQAAQDIVAKVAAETCGLFPADFQIFANAIGGSGGEQRAKIGDHLLSLFSGLLTAAIRSNDSIATSFGEFIDMLMEKPRMAPGDVGSHTLHRLHARLLYDCSDWVRGAPAGFGDIYTRRGDKDNYYIVLTPECDLEPRTKDGIVIGPKVPFIILLSGELRDERPPDRERDNEVVTPLIVDDDTESVRWVYWQLQKPRIVPAKRLSPDSRRFTKWGRLRVQEAEKIQMRYATDLLAVGTDDLSDRVTKRSAVLWKIDDKMQTQLFDFCLMEIVNPKKRDEIYWALAADCEHLLCNDLNRILPAGTLTELRVYQLKKEFIEKLRPFKIRLAEPPPNASKTPQIVSTTANENSAGSTPIEARGKTQEAGVSANPLPVETASEELGTKSAESTRPPEPTSEGSILLPATRPVLAFGWFTKQAPSKWGGPDSASAPKPKAESSTPSRPTVDTTLTDSTGGPAHPAVTPKAAE